MSTTRSPNYANNPTAITLPDDGDDKPVASLIPAVAALEDMMVHLGGLTLSLGDLATRPVGIPGDKVFVPGSGWYSSISVATYTADGVWVVDTADGQWIHEEIDLVNFGRLAAVGTVPGGVYVADTAGRIPRRVIDHGYLTHGVSDAPMGKSGTYAAITTVFDQTDAAGLDIGALAIGDIIDAKIYGFVFVIGTAMISFGFFTELSADGGATWSAMTENGFPYYSALSGQGQAVDLSFAYKVAAAGDHRVRIRAQFDGVHTLSVTLRSFLIWVTRP